MSNQTVQTANKKVTLRVEEYINTYMRQSTVKTCVKNFILDLEKNPEFAKLIPIPKVKDSKPDDPTKPPKVPKQPKKPVDPNKPKPEKPKYKLNKRAILYLTVISDYIVSKIVGKTVEKVKNDNKKIIQPDNFSAEPITGVYWKLTDIPTSIDDLKKTYTSNKNLLTIKNAIKKQIDIEKGEFKKSDIFTGYVALNIENFIKKICERLFMNGIHSNSKTIKYEDLLYVLTERADAHLEIIPEEITKKYIEVDAQFTTFETFKNDKEKKTLEPPKTTKFSVLDQKPKAVKQQKTDKPKETKEKKQKKTKDQPTPDPVQTAPVVIQPEPAPEQTQKKTRGGRRKNAATN